MRGCSRILSCAVVLALTAMASGCDGGTPGSSLGGGDSSGGGGEIKAPGGDTAFPPGADSPNPPVNDPTTDPGTPVMPGGPGSAGGGGISDPTAGVAATTIRLNPGSTGTTPRSSQTSNVSLANGRYIALNLEIEGANAFQVVANVGDTIRTDALFSPSGAQLFDALDPFPWLSLAGQYDTFVNTLNYPSNGGDPDVVPGTYLQSISTQNLTAGDVTITTIAKNDPNFSSGVVRVNLFFVGSEANGDSEQRAIRDAVDIWRTIFSQVGLTLDVQEIELQSDTDVLPDPGSGDSFYEIASRNPSAQDFAVNVFVAEDIEPNVQDPAAGVLGIAGGIPGAGIPGAKSAVSASLTTVRGPDGFFTNDELSLLGETLAHEVGHYLGLFHPVQFLTDGVTFVEGDVLPDTETCADLTACIESPISGNLMFPSALPGVRQTAVSPNQGRVMNLQAIVD